MKRYIKKLFEEYEWERLAGFAISGIAGIIVALWLGLYIVDTKPATPEDYILLEEQISNIQQDPQILLKTDCKINVADEVITVELENEECKIITLFNENFETLSVSKEDKSRSYLFAIGFALLFGICTFYGGGWMITLLILLIKAITMITLNKVKLIHKRT